MPLTVGPASFAFRAHRVHQNSLENSVLFIVALGAALLAGAAPAVVNTSAAAFVGARVAHAVAYYAGVERPRTAAFALGLVAILALIGAAGATLAR